MKVPAIAAVFAFCIAGQTGNPEMSADRPGFQNSADFLEPGTVQVESGFDVSTGTTVTMAPAFRIGAFRWLELRLGAENVVLRSPLDAEAGISDLQPGIKFPVFARGNRTSVVAILKSTVPSGHASRRSGYQPAAELIWEHKFTDDFSLSGTWNLTRLQDDRLWQRGAAVAANRSLGKSLDSFAEVYVVSQQELGRGNQWAVDAGIMRNIGEFLALDVAAGHSIHGQADWFATAGISVRIRRRSGSNGSGGRR